MLAGPAAQVELGVPAMLVEVVALEPLALMVVVAGLAGLEG